MHELIQQIMESGCLERFHHFWEEIEEGFGPYKRLQEWQDIVDYGNNRGWMNVVPPFRGHNRHPKPPLVLYQ